MLSILLSSHLPAILPVMKTDMNTEQKTTYRLRALVLAIRELLAVVEVQPQHLDVLEEAQLQHDLADEYLVSLRQNEHAEPR